MEISINHRMRELRASKGNTQEQLASYLGLTTQAVSKWERGEGYPDIATLPEIAAFYNVTIDHLLGFDDGRKQQKLREYMTKSTKLSEDPSALISLWREAYREFPNEPTVLHNLSFALRAESLDDHSVEIITIARRLLNEAVLSGEYFGAINNLCRAYKCQGNIADAKKYAAMAGRYVGTENQLMIHILDGEDAVAYCQWNIQTLVDLIATNTSIMLQKGTYTNEEALRLCQLIINLFSLTYEDGEYGFYHCRVSRWSMHIAKCYALSQNKDETLRHLDKAIHHAKRFDFLSEGHYTATIVDRQSYRANPRADQLPARLKELEDSCFDFIRNDTQFKQLLNICKAANSNISVC